MRIAIVGYGSLIWDLENLEPFVSGQWSLGSGPKIPVEFSRISPKRKKALVLVIDHSLKHQCATNIIKSSRPNIDDAINDLAARERCKPDMIGYLDKSGSTYKSFTDVEDWLEKSTYDGVIWTALPYNYELETGEKFSHESGVKYLQTLNADALAEAWRYIEFAPEVTDTPFRRFLQHNEFWQSLDFPEVGA